MAVARHQPAELAGEPVLAAPCLTRLVDVIGPCRLCQQAGYPVEAPPRLLGLTTVDGDATRADDYRPRLVIIGQAPGRQGGAYPVPFTSPYGRTIARWLGQAGFPPDDLPRRAHLTALTRCFPGSSATGKGDRAPSRAEIDLCAAYLRTELALLRPAVVLTIGKLATDRFHGRSRPLGAAIGSGWERDGVRYLPLPHPSGVSRWLNDPANRALVDRALALLSAWREELAL